MSYVVRGSNPFPYTPKTEMTNDNYGSIVRGNTANSFYRLTNPEGRRRQFLRRNRVSIVRMNRRKRKMGYGFIRI